MLVWAENFSAAENLENGHPERTPKNLSDAENLEDGHAMLRSVVAVVAVVPRAKRGGFKSVD